MTTEAKEIDVNLLKLKNEFVVLKKGLEHLQIKILIFQEKVSKPLILWNLNKRKIFIKDLFSKSGYVLQRTFTHINSDDIKTTRKMKEEEEVGNRMMKWWLLQTCLLLISVRFHSLWWFYFIRVSALEIAHQPSIHLIFLAVLLPLTLDE